MSKVSGTYTEDEFRVLQPAPAKPKRVVSPKYCANLACHYEFLNDDPPPSSEDRCKNCQAYWDRHQSERPDYLVREQRRREQAKPSSEPPPGPSKTEVSIGNFMVHDVVVGLPHRPAREPYRWGGHHCVECGRDPARWGYGKDGLNRAGRCHGCAKKHYNNPARDLFDYQAWQADGFAADEWDINAWRRGIVYDPRDPIFDDEPPTAADDEVPPDEFDDGPVFDEHAFVPLAWDPSLCAVCGEPRFDKARIHTFPA